MDSETSSGRKNASAHSAENAVFSTRMMARRRSFSAETLSAGGIVSEYRVGSLSFAKTLGAEDGNVPSRVRRHFSGSESQNVEFRTRS